jgi:hypothetical protein
MDIIHPWIECLDRGNHEITISQSIWRGRGLFVDPEASISLVKIVNYIIISIG